MSHGHMFDNEVIEMYEPLRSPTNLMQPFHTDGMLVHVSAPVWRKVPHSSTQAAFDQLRTQPSMVSLMAVGCKLDIRQQAGC